MSGPLPRTEARGVASPSYVAGLLRAGLVRPKRRLGQNFLVDRNVLCRMVRELDPAGRDVIEVGAGLGALTLALAEAGASRVAAIEKDRALAGILAGNVAGRPEVRLVLGDALEVDFRKLAREMGSPGGSSAAPGGAQEPLVAGNLPYSVTTPLLLKLLEPPVLWPRAIVMVQLEVAERILARPGTKDYGALTLAVAAVAEPRLVFRVGPRSFYPAPEVDTAVLLLRRRETPAGDLDPAGLQRLSAVVRAAFGQRRKMLGNALAAGLDLERSVVADRLGVAGLNPSRRGETLSLEEFLTLEETLRDLLPATGEPV